MLSHLHMFILRLRKGHAPMVSDLLSVGGLSELLFLLYKEQVLKMRAIIIISIQHLSHCNVFINQIRVGTSNSVRSCFLFKLFLYFLLLQKTTKNTRKKKFEQRSCFLCSEDHVPGMGTEFKAPTCKVLDKCPQFCKYVSIYFVGVDYFLILTGLWVK